MLLLVLGIFYNSLIGYTVPIDKLHTQLYVELGMDADVCRMAGNLL